MIGPKEYFLLPNGGQIRDKLQVLPFGLRASNVSIEGENTLISTLPLARTLIEAFDRERQF